jgi:hypothetical protein
VTAVTKHRFLIGYWLDCPNGKSPGSSPPDPGLPDRSLTPRTYSRVTAPLLLLLRCLCAVPDLPWNFARSGATGSGGTGEGCG